MDLSYNLLVEFPYEICTLFKLHLLNVGHNQITSLPASIGQLYNLKYLDVSHNKITTLPSTLGNINLRNLDTSENKLVWPKSSVIEKGVKAILAYLRGSHFSKVIDDKKFSDAVLVINGYMELPIHAVIMHMRWKYFRDHYDAEKKRIFVNDVDEAAMEVVMEFLYSDTFTKKLDEDDVSKVNKLAEKFELERLKTLSLCSLENSYFSKLCFQEFTKFDFTNYFDKKVFSDISLIAGEKKIYCHKGMKIKSFQI